MGEKKKKNFFLKKKTYYGSLSGLQHIFENDTRCEDELTCQSRVGSSRANATFVLEKNEEDASMKELVFLMIYLKCMELMKIKESLQNLVNLPMKVKKKNIKKKIKKMKMI